MPSSECASKPTAVLAAVMTKPALTGKGMSSRPPVLRTLIGTDLSKAGAAQRAPDVLQDVRLVALHDVQCCHAVHVHLRASQDPDVSCKQLSRAGLSACSWS